VEICWSPGWVCGLAWLACTVGNDSTNLVI
jgi:hypothetical protein